MSNKEYKPVWKPDGLADEEYFKMHDEYIRRNDFYEQEIMYCKYNPEYFWASWCWLVNKNSEWQLFRLNDVQKKYHNSGITDREMILKARKDGRSTYFRFKIFHLCNFYENINAISMAHEKDTAVEIHRNTLIANEKLPDWMRLDTNRESKLEIAYPELNSRIQCGTAMNLSSKRGYEVTHLHESEIFFYPDIKAVTSGVERSARNGQIWREGTADGWNEAKEEWEKAVEGKSNFRPVFTPWHENPENKYSDDDLEKEYASLEAKDKSYLDALTIDRKQQSWWIRERKDLPNLPIMKQENPSNVEDAFISAGSKYFSVDILTDMLNRLDNRKPVQTMHNGLVKIYEKPRDGVVYTIGADPADEGESKSAAQIIDDDLNQVGIINGDIAPDDFTDLLVKVANMFNEAVIAVESNNHGGTVLERLKSTHEYAHIYKDVKYDRYTNIKQRRPGFNTTKKSKPKACGLLLAALKDGSVNLVDKTTVKQMMAFTIQLKSKINDDLVLALAIALWSNKYFEKFKRY